MSSTGADSDQELWERLRTGDHLALGELFDRYADDVRAFAFRRTASWSTADDVVQANGRFTVGQKLEEEVRAFDTQGNPIRVR